jgi:hypothetical protein
MMLDFDGVGISDMLTGCFTPRSPLSRDDDYRVMRRRMSFFCLFGTSFHESFPVKINIKWTV